MKNNLLALVLLPLLVSCSGMREQGDTRLTPSTFPGIRIHVVDEGTGEPLSARIVVRTGRDSVLQSYYSALDGVFTDENGTLEMELGPGEYSVSVYHGIEHLSQDFTMEVSPGEGMDAEVALEMWIPLKSEGWINGGGHCHLYTEKDKDSALLSKVRRICLAQGVDFLCAAQGWAGYSDTSWKEGYSRFSDDRFLLSYGSEMPKYRTGHTWWIGQESTRDFFWNTMDEQYETQYFQSATGTGWNFEDLDFPYIPSPEVIQRFGAANSAVAIMAHPTSWWWQDRGDITKYTSNVAAYLSFGLLAGKLWDGLVVMGYNHDHYFYQNLWFHVLNKGYRMPAISELDQGPNPSDRFYYGSMRTYYRVGGDFSIPAAARAVRTGETFVTSGPVIFADIDGTYGYGDVVPADGSGKILSIEAYASGDREDHLTYLVMYRNGEVNRVWDLREKKPRKFRETVRLEENEDAWYVLKAYGKKAWESPDYLDIMALCDKDFTGAVPPNHGDLMDVCITSPFYFRTGDNYEPEPLVSRVKLTLTDANGRPVEEAGIDILVNGRSRERIRVSDGNASLEMPAGAMLRITDGTTTIHRGLYMDYPPHRSLLEELSSGRWIGELKASRNFVPGEVPWEAFRFEETREVLQNVDWKVTLAPNERDGLWEDFEQRFNEL